MQRTTQPESRASEGAIERAEFGELYLRYRDPVFRYVRRLSGSEDEAADLTALTFEHALAKLHGYRGEGHRTADFAVKPPRLRLRVPRRRVRLETTPKHILRLAIVVGPCVGAIEPGPAGTFRIPLAPAVTARGVRNERSSLPPDTTDGPGVHGGLRGRPARVKARTV